MALKKVENRARSSLPQLGGDELPSLAGEAALVRDGALAAAAQGEAPNALGNWPVQLKLVSAASPVFHDRDLLVAADCTAYAYGNFHRDFIRGRVTVIGCPKLDATEYAEKLTQILEQNSVKSVTLTRMFVPCCGGMEYAVYQAIAACGRDLPLRVVTIGADGAILSDEKKA